MRYQLHRARSGPAIGRLRAGAFTLQTARENRLPEEGGALRTDSHSHALLRKASRNLTVKIFWLCVDTRPLTPGSRHRERHSVPPWASVRQRTIGRTFQFDFFFRRSFNHARNCRSGQGRLWARRANGSGGLLRKRPLTRHRPISARMQRLTQGLAATSRRSFSRQFTRKQTVRPNCEC